MALIVVISYLHWPADALYKMKLDYVIFKHSVGHSSMQPSENHSDKVLMFLKCCMRFIWVFDFFFFFVYILQNIHPSNININENKCHLHTEIVTRIRCLEDFLCNCENSV